MTHCVFSLINVLKKRYFQKTERHEVENKCFEYSALTIILNVITVIVFKITVIKLLYVFFLLRKALNSLISLHVFQVHLSSRIDKILDRSL